MMQFWWEKKISVKKLLFYAYAIYTFVCKTPV